MQKPLVFETPWVLLCEGPSDMRFFQRLIHAHAITPGFFVCFPNKHPGDGGGGRTRFGSWIANQLVVNASFREKVNAVLIIADNDADSQNAFEEVRKSLTDNNLPVPPQERVPARQEGVPAIVLAKIPFDAEGNLETLCLPVAYETWPHQEALDNYVAATPAAGWSVGKQSKMRIQSLLAASCQSKPDVSFNHHWSEAEHYRLSVTHDCFNPLVTFLREFGALFDSA